ncbi:MAG: NADH-quinone oxidoreductase subunit NuoE [Armatimonadetes bacterium]|nr:NADH-quinone oxidoreductase subunit NuoE [Armatimonadota bacterium]
MVESITNECVPDVLAVIDEMNVSSESNLIAVLQDMQEHFGYLPPAALQEISSRIHIPLARIYGVVTFYAQFHTEPRGRHTIRCCRGTACHVEGAGRVLRTIEKELGISDGETTPDGLFSLETLGCIGICFLAPAMMIDDQYFGNLTTQRVGSILRTYGARSCLHE